ncbi:MAG: uncharacterized protein QG622_3640 [Actinomycetota bacterium]|nr:uncharacterized protein [Actinomycetota bacterium]
MAQRSISSRRRPGSFLGHLALVACLLTAGAWSGADRAAAAADTMQDDLKGAVQTSEHFWRTTFAKNRLRFTPVAEVYAYDRAHRTRCGPAVLPLRNASYCVTDDDIAFDVDWLQGQYNSLGDTFVYYVIGHEYAHAVQRRLGIDHRLTIAHELQADCFAGAYLDGEVDAGNLSLDDGDVEELAASLRKVSDPEGTPWFDPRAHGSVSQRTAAFVRGSEEGLSSCLR